MAIDKIDAELCNGCGICVDACWMDVIRLDKESNKAVIRYPGDCIVCGFCQTDCPRQAITVSPVKAPPALTVWGG